MSKTAILCVDDEVIILLSLIQELKKAFGNRFIYEKAHNGDSALKLIQELDREGIKTIFIITDWLMPGKKGDALLEEIREHFPDTKAILITGQADQEAIDRILANKLAISVLQKPWRPELLKKTIEAHMSV